MSVLTSPRKKEMILAAPSRSDAAAHGRCRGSPICGWKRGGWPRSCTLAATTDRAVRLLTDKARVPSQPGCRTAWPHGALILANAFCIGRAETTINPSNGASMSTIRTTAPAIESPQTNSATATIALRGAKRPKLMNKTQSYTNRTIRNGCVT